jgi:hypothetical protein
MFSDSEDLRIWSTRSVAACICIFGFYTSHDIDSAMYDQIHVDLNMTQFGRVIALDLEVFLFSGCQ